MKHVLVDYRGLVSDVVEPGGEFPVYNGPNSPIRWVTCEVDSIDSTWMLIDGQWIAPNQRYENGQNLKRQIAYGDVGEQLDMMYKDMVDGGTRWKDHVANVKATIESESAFDANPTNREGKVEVRLSDESNPAWNNLPEGSRIIEVTEN
jgi:hypothetical protein